MNTKSAQNNLKNIYFASAVLIILIVSIFSVAFSFNKSSEIKYGFAAIPGDCGGPNGTPDGFVDLFDYGNLSRSFGLTQGQPGFNAACDFFVDSHNIIDLLDYGILAQNFGKTPTHTPAITSTPQISSTLTPTLPNYGLKQPIRGLVFRDQSSYVSNSAFSFVDYGIAKINWSDLERETPDGTGSYKQANGTDMPGWQTIDTLKTKLKGLHIRIIAGVGAPVFVKRLGHSPVSGGGTDCSSGGIAIQNSQGFSGCSAFFWTKEVGDQYEQLITEIARRYDSDPKILGVEDSLCTTLFQEPFNRQNGNIATTTRLWEAGLNYNTDLACQERAITIHKTHLARTRTYMDVAKQWQIIDGSNDHCTPTWNPMKNFADWAKGQMGARLLLRNGIHEQDGCPNYLGQTDNSNEPQMCYIKSQGKPFGFQTNPLSAMGGETGLFNILESAKLTGAAFIELPSGYGQVIDTSKLREYDSILEGNL